MLPVTENWTIDIANITVVQLLGDSVLFDLFYYISREVFAVLKYHQLFANLFIL